MPVAERSQRMMSFKEVPLAALAGIPFVARRCDALGCGQIATRNCSGHGVHFCPAHFDTHRQEWHASQWESALRVGLA